MKRPWYLFLKEAVFVVAFILLVNLSGCQENARGGGGMTTSESVFGDYLSARFARKEGNLDKASSYYSTALSKDPDNPSLLQETFELMVLSGEVRKAIYLAKNLKNPEKENHLLQMLLAIDAIKNKNFGGIENILEYPSGKVTKINEFTAIAVPMMLVWSEVGMGNYEKAIGILEETSRISTAQFTVYQEALIYSMDKNNKDHLQKAEASFDGIMTAKQPYRIIKKAADIYERAGKHEKAERVISEFIERNPEFKIDVLNNRKLKTEPIEKDELVINNVAEVLLDIADLLYGNDKFENATLYLRMAIFLNPKSDYIKIMLANVLEKRNNYSDALDIYDSISEDSVFYWKSKINAALSHARNGNPEKTKKLLYKISEERPESYDVLLNLGDFMMGEKEFAQAVEIYTKVLNKIKDPKDKSWGIYYARGICNERLKSWDKAEADFLKALDIEPKQPDVMNYLGYGWLLMDKNLDKAEKILRTAFISRPYDAYIMDSYGWALYKLGKYNDALKFLERANLKIPFDPTTNDHLGDIYWRTGRKTEAVFQWKRALGFDPEPEEANNIKKKLEEGLPPLAMVETSSSDIKSSILEIKKY